MKKKELILDFTSLLDVIMILLFVVISNINQVSLSANEMAEEKLLEAQSQIDELNNERDELLGKIESAEESERDYEDISIELDELKLEYEALQNEFDYLKITSNYDAEDMSVYKAALF